MISTLTPAESGSLQSHGLDKGVCIADVLSTAQQTNNGECKSDRVTGYNLLLLTVAEREE